MWPTPAARSFQPPRKPETMAKTGRNPLTNTLEDAVQYREIEKQKLWPTPTANEPRDMKKIDHYVETGEIRHSPTGYKNPRRLMLEETVIAEEKKKQKLWPTPRARDWKDGYGVPPSVEKGTRGHTLGTKVQE
tara:strand:- start:2 stop:400 length:399 start_codon:yes stop_codon:yes gene_type:complete